MKCYRRCKIYTSNSSYLDVKIILRLNEIFTNVLILFLKMFFFVKSLFYSIQVSLNLFLKVSCSIMVNILLFPINSGQVPVDYCAIIGFSQLSSDQFFLGCDWFWSVLRFSNRVVINFDKINYDLVTKAQN